MKVYIAAPWVNKREAAAAGKLFEAAGHTLTKKWWEHREVVSTAERNPELEEQAEDDLAGVLNADAFVLLNLAKSEGKAVETGMALMLGLPMVLVGARTNLFHYLSDWAIVSTIEEALDVLALWY